MSIKAIIHTTTRVVRRLTTDDPPPIMGDETAIVVPSADLAPVGATRWWKLDVSNNIVPATQAEADAAGMDEEAANARKKAALIALKAVVNDIVVNGATLVKIRLYFIELNKVL